MEIVISSICLGNINRILKKEGELSNKKNFYILDVASIQVKENALLLKAGCGYIDFDNVKTEEELKKLYKEINALGEFRDGCGILKDTIPFTEKEGDIYVDHETIKDVNFPSKKKKVHFKTLKKFSGALRSWAVFYFDFTLKGVD